jgi:hypothetical protein
MTDGTISGNRANRGGGVFTASNANNYFKMSEGTISGNRATYEGAAVMRYNLGTFEKTDGIIYGNSESDENNANKAADGFSNVTSIQMKYNNTPEYFNGTADANTILKHSSVNGYVNVGSWSK